MKKNLIIMLCAAAASVAQGAIDSTTKPAYNGLQIGEYAPSTSTAGITITGTDGNVLTVDTTCSFAATFTLSPTVLQQAMTTAQTTDKFVALAGITMKKSDGTAAMNWSVAVQSTGITLTTLDYNNINTTTPISGDGKNHWDVDINNGSSFVQTNISTGLNTVTWSNIENAALTLSYYHIVGTNGQPSYYGTQLCLTLLDNQGNYSTYVGQNTDFRSTGDVYAPSTLTVNGDLVYSAYIFDNTSLNDEATRITNNKGAMALVPEPATATLSLLALAGLAARRRRK